jgi:hypothetical protein
VMMNETMKAWFIPGHFKMSIASTGAALPRLVELVNLLTNCSPTTQALG